MKETWAKAANQTSSHERDHFLEALRTMVEEKSTMPIEEELARIICYWSPGTCHDAYCICTCVAVKPDDWTTKAAKAVLAYLKYASKGGLIMFTAGCVALMTAGSVMCYSGNQITCMDSPVDVAGIETCKSQRERLTAQTEAAKRLGICSQDGSTCGTGTVITAPFTVR